MTDDANLTRCYGSPLYVYDRGSVREALRDLRAALPAPAVVYYSLKANPHPDLAAVLRAGGCRAEISSQGELSAALAAGFDGVDCLYTGPAKTEEEITAAINAGVSRFSVESVGDFRRVATVAAATGTTARCLVRVATTAGGSAGLRMTGTPTQFGVDRSQLCADPRGFADLPGARVVGCHFFPLSNAADEESLSAAMAVGIATAAQLRREAGIRMAELDLGGGFAAPYAKPGERPRYSGLRERLEAELDEYLPGWRGGDPAVAFESGRYLVGDCGRLICSVTDVKHRAGRTFVLLNSGINHFGGLSGIGRMLPAAVPVAPGGYRGSDRPGGTEVAPVTLAGPLCTPADVVAREARLTPLAAGDLVVFPNLGAYGLTASLVTFLGRPAPVELVLDGTRVISVSRLSTGRTYSVPPNPRRPGAPEERLT